MTAAQTAAIILTEIPKHYDSEGWSLWNNVLRALRGVDTVGVTQKLEQHGLIERAPGPQVWFRLTAKGAAIAAA